jgi:hypothetical protein
MGADAREPRDVAAEDENLPANGDENADESKQPKPVGSRSSLATKLAMRRRITKKKK